MFADFEHPLVRLFGVVDLAVFEVGFGEPIERFDVVGVARQQLAATIDGRFPIAIAGIRNRFVLHIPALP